METRLEKRGSRLALRIPKALASEAGLEEGRPVRLSLMEGKPAIDSVAEPMFSLDELLASVTTENLHGAAGTGPAAGGKAWWTQNPTRSAASPRTCGGAFPAHQ